MVVGVVAVIAVVVIVLVVLVAAVERGSGASGFATVVEVDIDGSLSTDSAGEHAAARPTNAISNTEKKRCIIIRVR